MDEYATAARSAAALCRAGRALALVGRPVIDLVRTDSALCR
jgi:hypothetical protein